MLKNTSSFPKPTPRLRCPIGYQNRVKEQFEVRSRDYDARGDYHRSLAQLLLATAKLCPGERVLDAATGTGIVAFLAAQQVGINGSVHGVDLSPSMIDIVSWLHVKFEKEVPI